jgi:hypothetical protein
MAYGRSTGPRLGGPRKGGGFSLRTDMKDSAIKGKKKAPKAARKKV